MVYVLGHKNPDTDSYCSAVAYAAFLRDLGQDAQAIVLGNPNKETQVVFEKAGVTLPEVKMQLEEGASIILVDHNEAGQSIDNREAYVIEGVIDHHKIADFSTTMPVMMRFDTVGCTCTILRELFREKGYTPSKEIAQLMLSAIISDTLYFRSPTTTQRDKDAVEALATLCGMRDPEEYSLELFTAKSDLGVISAHEMLMMDYKDFTFGSTKVGIGVIETTNPSYALGRKTELIQAMNEQKKKEGLSAVLLCIVDILKENNICLIASSDEEAVIQGAFGAMTHDGEAALGSIISRKKELVPMLETYFQSR